MYLRGLRDIPSVTKVEELPTTVLYACNLKFTVKEDTTKVRDAIARCVYSSKPAGMPTEGKEKGKVKTPWGEYLTINFNLEVLTYDTWLEELDEGSACFDSKCSGTMKFDCSNNLRCDVCNCNLEELRVEDKNGSCDRRTGRTTRQIRNAPKGAYFLATHDVSDILIKEGRRDITPVDYRRINGDFSSLRGVCSNKLVIDHYLEETGRLPLLFKDFIGGTVKKTFIDTQERGAGGKFDLPQQEYVLGTWDSVSVPRKMNLEARNGQTKTQKEKQTMTKLNRKQVKVTLIDNDANLPANKAIVYSKELISDGTREDIIREVLFEGEIVEALHKHNKVRETIIDEGILQRVGNEVKLRPIELKDLDWNVE